MDCVILQTESVQDALRVKAFIVQSDPLEVGFVILSEMLRKHVGNHDILEIVESMSPESGIPGFVDGLDCLVLVFQPLPECPFAVLTVAFSAVFIGDMPGDDIIVGFVTFGQSGSQGRCIFAVGRAVGAGIVSAAEFTFQAIFVGPENIRIFAGHPGGMGTGGGGKTDLHAMFRDQFHNPVQLIKTVGILIRLQHCPAEDVQRDDVDVRQFQQAHIFLPGFFRPLFRIIVSSVEDLFYFIALNHLL